MIGLPSRRRQPRPHLQHEAVRRRGPRLPDERLDLGRLPHRGEGADRLLAVTSTARRTRSSGSEDTIWRFWPQLWQNGGECSTPTVSPRSTPQAGVDALEMLAADGRRRQERLPRPERREVRARASTSGNIGMIISGPWVLYDLKQAGHAYGVTFLPGTDGSHQTISGPDLWVLLDHDDAAPGGRHVRLHQLADRAGAGRPVERRLRQPAAARVGGVDTGVPGSSRRTIRVETSSSRI